MTIEEQVQATLAADAGVTALVPASRIRVPGNWQALTRPCIVHQPVSSDPYYMHEGRAALTNWGSVFLLPVPAHPPCMIE